MNSAHTVRRLTCPRVCQIAALALFLFVCVSGAMTAHAQTGRRQVTVLHTGNLNGRMGAATAVRTYYDRIQREVGRVLLVDAGGAMLRSEQAFEHSGGAKSFTVGALNSLNYDAWVLGAGELERPQQELSAALREARFAALGANLHQPDTGRPLFQVQPFAIVQAAGLRVGVLGLSEGSARVSVADPVQAAAYYVPLLAARCDLVCVLSSLGAEADSMVATGVEGIQLIVGTRQDTALAEPARIGGAVLAAVGNRDLTLGRIDLTLDDDGQVTAVAAKHIPLDAAAGPGEALAGWTAPVDGEALPLAASLGTVEGLTPDPGSGPSLGNLVADLVREAASAHIGFIAGTNVHPVVGPGVCRVLDLYRVYERPLHLEMVIVQGAQVRAFLEGSLSTPTVPFYPSGLEVVYDFSRPEGSRVVMAKVGQVLLNDEREYRVVVEDGIAGPKGLGPGLGEMIGAGSRTQTGVLVRDLIGRHVRDTGRLEGRDDDRVQQQ